MELALFVYFAGIVSKLSTMLVITSLIGLAGIVIYLIVVGGILSSYTNRGPDKKTFSDYFPNLRKLIIGVFCLGVVTAMIPSEKTMYLMLAGYTTQQVVQSETGDKVVKVINAKLDEYLEDMSKVQKEKK